MKLIKSFAVSLIALAAGAVSAGEFWQNGPSATLSAPVTDQGSGTAVVFPPGYNGSAVQFRGTFGAGPGNFLRFFCIEFDPISGSAETYNLGTTALGTWAPNAYTNLQKLYDLYYPDNGQVDFYNGANTNFGVFGSNDLAAAFQLAVWEIVFDDNLDLSVGGFTGDTNTYSGTAQGYLNAVAGYVGTGYTDWTVYTLTNASHQDFVTARINVPEPGSLALAGLALAGLGFVSRRRRS